LKQERRPREEVGKKSEKGQRQLRFDADKTENVQGAEKVGLEGDRRLNAVDVGRAGELAGHCCCFGGSEGRRGG
jgi:hypothetical protein